jgi:hypothetical protein
VLLRISCHKNPDVSQGAKATHTRGGGTPPPGVADPPRVRDSFSDTMNAAQLAAANAANTGRSKYKCGICGQPKKGHICQAQTSGA